LRFLRQFSNRFQQAVFSATGFLDQPGRYERGRIERAIHYFHFVAKLGLVDGVVFGIHCDHSD
jgi:hypothetical protein